MTPETLQDNAEILAFLRENTPLHFYSIGDLDPFFRPRSTYFGLREQGELRAVILLYDGPVTTLLVLGEYLRPLRNLLRALLPQLPQRIYLHLSPGLESVLKERYRMQSAGLFTKMQLVNSAALDQVPVDNVIRLRPDNDEQEVQEFLDATYPGNWFDPTMLATKHYYGLREQGRLIGVGGVHLFSAEYRVAAIGNIAVHPDWRNRCLGAAIVSRLCRELLQEVDFIGLNVMVENQAALALYDRLGFKTTNHYGEFFAGV